MKRLIAFLLFLLPLFCFADDPRLSIGSYYGTNQSYLADNTAALQAHINAGNYTIPLGTGPFNITHLLLTHSLDANGNTIHCTATTGAAFKFTVANQSLLNAAITGVSSTPNPSGVSAISVAADGATVAHCTVSTFTAYGIIGGYTNNFTANNNVISDIGFLGVFWISNMTGNPSGFTFFGNVIDRTAQGIGVRQPALAVRTQGSATMTGVNVHDNVIRMPLNPIFADAENFDGWGLTRPIYKSNQCDGGSIGFSIVRSSNYAQITRNKSTRANREGFEIGDLVGALFDRDTVSSGHIGFLVDGVSLCQSDTISNCKILALTGTNPYPIEMNSAFISGIAIINPDIVTTTQAVYMHFAHDITISGGSMTGNNTTVAVFFDTSIGGVTCTGTAFSGFTRFGNGYALVPTVINNILTVGVTPATSFLSISYTFPVSLGANIRWNPGLPPTVNYVPSSQSYLQFVIITPISPVVTNSPTSFSISPALGSGLLFETTTGGISGSPLIPQASTPYVVVAHNSYGDGSTGISIEVTASGSNIIRVSGRSAIIVPPAP